MYREMWMDVVSLPICISILPHKYMYPIPSSTFKYMYPIPSSTFKYMYPIPSSICLVSLHPFKS
uniref:Uncharacterized protein n=1 Tax=Picea glauca TaxID=3330 RepID=A0A117NIY6_PICGL|nr:hypothetical protein ABT39_MTgene551 [Picea glauca]QHR89393.1 hypothetical protein Q903MT_gene3414 [Picea sitchensis]